jgi:hypothetical protein
MQMPILKKTEDYIMSDSPGAYSGKLTSSYGT